jgi:hypothetical protein
MNAVVGFHEQLARRARRAQALKGMLSSLEIRVPMEQRTLGAGETYAVKTLQRLIKKYGQDIVILALRCINETRGGNPGELRADAITAISVVLAEHEGWRNAGLALFVAFDSFDFAAARAASSRFRNGDGHGVMVGLVVAHLKSALGD